MLPYVPSGAAMSYMRGCRRRCAFIDWATKSVRVSVRELGATPAETNRKQFPSRVDFIGSCRLVLFLCSAISRS